ncbi:hypothetical protein TrLO_g6160, partial [Triparma laevis f. longispina]
RTIIVPLSDNEEYEEAIIVHERCLAGRMNVLQEDHQNTVESLNNLGSVYAGLKKYEKTLEYYERALNGNEKLLGKNHTSTLMTLENIAVINMYLKNFGKAEELYQTALEGYEGQLGKDHKNTMKCARLFRNSLATSGNEEERLLALTTAYPWLNEDDA